MLSSAVARRSPIRGKATEGKIRGRLRATNFGVRSTSPAEIRTPSVPTTAERPRTLTVTTPFFIRREKWKKIVVLEPRPPELPGGEIDQRAWRRYQAYLEASRPWARADFYKRLMERKGCRSIRALARVTGEDWSRVARVMRLLELPEPVLEYLRTHDSPELVRQFTEKRLHELLALRDTRRILGRFQTEVEQLGG